MIRQSFLFPSSSKKKWLNNLPNYLLIRLFQGQKMTFQSQQNVENFLKKFKIFDCLKEKILTYYSRLSNFVISYRAASLITKG